MIDKVKIGAIVYDVTIDDTLGDSGFAGQIRYQRCTIVINGDLKPQFAMQTLWHEVIHGIMTNAGIPHEDQTEPLVNAIAYGVYQVLLDNPEIMDIDNKVQKRREAEILGMFNRVP